LRPSLRRTAIDTLLGQPIEIECDAWISRRQTRMAWFAQFRNAHI
jgi:hypothetical protein